MDKIYDDQHDIERLKNLEFIGEAETLLKTMTGTKKIKPLGNLKSDKGKLLYIKASGTRSEMISNLKELISLFSFTQNIKI